MKQTFRLEEKKTFRVIGTKISTTNKKRQGREAVSVQWKKFHEQQNREKILPLMNQQPYGLFGISVYNTNSSDPYQFDYYIAVASDAKEADEFISYQIPEALWAVFPCTLKTIGKTQVQAITRWLPRAGYRPCNKGYLSGKMRSGAPDIEYYGENDSAEIWIAIQPVPKMR